MPEENKIGRSFSDEKHLSGQWRTRMVVTANPGLRQLFSYCSFKRSGVAALAKKIPAAPRPQLAVDLGSGQGAYAHWFLGGTLRGNVTVIAIDWSREALLRIPAPARGKIVKICADAGSIPLKSESADALFSLDTLGHVESIPKVLDEILRIAKPGAPLFLHSECGDYRTRWPDTMLMKRIGYDFLARYDDHRSVLPFAALRSLYTQRFHIDMIQSAAGYTGWLTGYPDKYRLAFAEAGAKTFVVLTSFFSFVKRMPLTGLLLRLLNSSINHLELALGLQGGGSCCALLHKPSPATPILQNRRAEPCPSGLISWSRRTTVRT